MTRFVSSLAILAAIPGILAHPAVLPRAQCYDHVLIHVRGTGEVPGTFFATRPMIDSINAAVPGGTIHETNYPAIDDLSQTSTGIGVDDISNVIQQGMRNCPEQKYAIIGYSQGATVTDRVLQKFAPDSAEGKAISGVLVMGNPYHIPAQTPNIDQDGGKSTVDAVGSLVLTKVEYRMPESWYNSGKVMDICYTNDSVCDTTNLAKLDLLGLHLNALNVADLLKTGQLHLKDIFNSAHLQYPASRNVQSNGARFIIDKLQG